MGRTAAFSLEFDSKHAQALEGKRQKIAVLVAILDMWQGRDDFDPDYIRGARKRLREAQSQLRAMAQ
jgi:hypothetical protein